MGFGLSLISGEKSLPLQGLFGTKAPSPGMTAFRRLRLNLTVFLQSPELLL